VAAVTPLDLFPEDVLEAAGDEAIVVGFAGVGGSCEGIRRALGRSPDVAINHDPKAIAVHRRNNPDTRHYVQNIWQVDPRDVVSDLGGRPIGLAWFSPDCRHFSKAKGSAPVSRSVRDLAWVVVLWAERARPRVIMLENVEEFRTWGPIDDETGRPCRDRAGRTFDLWLGKLRLAGYRVEFRELRAYSYGAPTTRKRLYLIARRDREPVVWPEATHDRPSAPAVLRGAARPWRVAAEVIDWSLPCPSIFLTREQGRAVGANRPLADATMARIAKGVQRYVLKAANPFIIPITHVGDLRTYGIDEPMRTITTANRGEHALVTPFLVPRYGERPGQEPRTRSIDEPAPTVVPTGNGGSLVAAFMARHFGASVGSAADEPVGTVTAGGGGKTALVAAFMAQHNGDRVGRGVDEPLTTIVHRGTQQALVATWLAQHNTDMVGHDPRTPMSTIVGKGCTQAVCSAGLVNLKGSDRRGSDVAAPVPTICARGTHVAQVAAFIQKYYGTGGQDQPADVPLHTVPTKGRFGLVTVMIGGEPWVIVDIGMRMLTPRELLRAQGFDDSYVIDGIEVDGRRLTKTDIIRGIGNSVSPNVADALVRANYVPRQARQAVAA
jgi:DNA (cytosine-5)-methyltransferase 1